MTGFALTAEYLGESRQRPPRVELHFTVHLVNNDDEPGWVLIPDALAPAAQHPGTQVYSLAGWLLGAHKSIQLLHATSDAGWFAVLLPPRAEVSLRGLPLGWWGESPAAVDICAYRVADLVLDGDPIAERLGLPETPLVDQVGDAGLLADPAAIKASINGTPHDPLQLSWAAESTVTARVEIPT